MASFALGCAALFFDFYRDAKATAVANLTETQRIHARQAALGVQDFFSTWTRTLEALARMEGVAGPTPAGRQAMALLFEAHGHHVRSVTRIDERGVILAAYPAATAEGLDISAQEHVAQILRTRKPVISDVFRAVQGFDAVALHVPVFEGGRFRGSVAVVVNFASLAQEFFDIIEIGRTSHVLVISRDGTLLYTPAGGLIGKPAYAAFRDDPALTALLGDMANGKSGTATYSMRPMRPPSPRPTRFYAAYQRIPLGDTHWSVMVASSEHEVLAGLDSFRNRLSFVIGLVFGGGLLSAFVVVRSRLIVREVRDRQRAEETLRSKEEHFGSIIDAAPDFVFSLDLEDRFLSANRALCEALGVSEAELVGHRVSETVPSEEEPGALAALRDEVLRTARPVQFRTAIVLRSGRKIVTAGTLSPLFDSGGKIRAISGVALDVTEEIRVAESLDRLSQAVEQASEVILMTDPGGVITYVNPAFEAVYGYPRSEALGKTPRIVKSDLYAKEDYERFWQAILSGKSVRDEIVNKRVDGRLVRVDRSVTPVFNEAQTIVGFLSVQTDVTERRRLEEEARALNGRMAELGKMEAIGTLAGGVAHDFNNILSVILSFAAVAEKSRNDDERFQKAVQTIRQAVNRGADLSKQVLTFARRVESTSEAVDLNDLLTEITGMVRSTFPRTIVVDASLADDLPLVIADGTQLHQAFLNLLINARDAMPNGGTVRVATRTAPGDEVRRHFPDAADPAYVLVQVSDTGTGMSEEVAQRIFEPFFTTKGGRGTGLGLAVTYGAVKSAGGSIRVESRRDHGTTFEIAFPIPESWTSFANKDATPHQELSGQETVLFVEDEPDLGPFMAEALEQRGYTVLLARDGAEALERLSSAERPADVIVSDDDMPRMRGRDLFAASRRLPDPPPFVMVSGFVDPESMDSLRKEGISQFLRKPYTVEELLATIRFALNAAGRRRRADRTTVPVG